MVDQEVTGQDRHPPLRRQLGYCLGVPDAQGERLLDHDGLACFYRLSSHCSVGGGRGRHNDGIHDPKQRRHVGGHERPGVLARDALANLGVSVAHGGQLAFGQSGDRPDVVPPPRPGADYADLESLHR